MDDIKHDLIQAVKSLAIELGRTPTRTEFASRVPKVEYRLRTEFKTYTALLIAAGLDTYVDRRAGRKIGNSIFEKDIVSHLEQYQPRESVERVPYPTILSISDIHWPFPNQKVIEAFIKYAHLKKPKYIILNGDAWDMYSHSKFPRSHNIFTPREEQSLARKMNEEFWKAVKNASPNSECIQMLGNHDIRPLRRVLESYPAAEDWIEKILHELFTFDGVKTIFDPREELILGDIAIFHGYRSQLGSHRDYTLMNTVNGHTHHGGVVYRRLRGQTLWELNSGFAGDPESKGLSYTPQKITTQTPGFGEVDEMGPRFIPIG